MHPHHESGNRGQGGAVAPGLRAGPGDYTRSLRHGVIVTLAFFTLEVGGGLYSGSLSLISDAGHMFIDASALLLSLAAIRASRTLPTKERTYGLYRAEIMAAFINGILLILVSVWILYEAIGRLASPQPVDSTVMLLVALGGLAANGYIALGLSGSSDLNVRSAFLHVLGDALTSLAVVAAAVWIMITGQTSADAVLSGIISAVILVSAARILRESAGILLQFTPRGLDYDRVIREMESVPGVAGVHDLHIWSLSSGIHVLDAHVYSCERDAIRLGEMKDQIKERLKGLSILHSTLEFECEECTEPGSPACILVTGEDPRPGHPRQ